jgi:hypothetical protein
VNATEAHMLRLRIYRLEAEHRDAVDAYIKTRRARHQARMVAISAQLAQLRQQQEATR